jgi:hypothetical protein
MRHATGLKTPLVLPIPATIKIMQSSNTIPDLLQKINLGAAATLIQRKCNRWDKVVRDQPIKQAPSPDRPPRKRRRR